jgi:putative colanic acid biosynthesis acetyltransferase WcaF
MPWRLEVGDNVWIGEEAYILNFENVRIGSNACISQRSFICTGNHDYRDPAMSYRNKPIIIEDGAWIGAQAFIAPGLTVGMDCVITAGSVLMKSAESGLIYMGNPAVSSGVRWRHT